MARVIVYSQPTCAACVAEKAWLRQAGIDFEERDVRASRAWLMQLLALGSRATPTTVVEGASGRRVVVGFDRAQLRACIDAG
jgi:glutaredoxin